MSEYKCDCCNYVSHDKFNYKRHQKSKKHAEKVHKQPYLSRIYPVSIIGGETCSEFKCVFCAKLFVNSGNLSRHKQVCSERYKLVSDCKVQSTELTVQLNEVNIKLFEQSKLLDQQVKLLDQKDETISILKSEVAHLKSIVNNAGSIIKSSISTMSFVIKNYKDAPALEPMKDYSSIRCDQDITGFVENLIYEYNHNKLHAHIGDFIIKNYKKDDPSQQSIWNSDTNRLTYLIRDIMNNNKIDWKVDKKGIKTTTFIIDPVLDYIDEQVRTYIENFDIDYDLDTARIAEQKMMKLKSGTGILTSIENKTLSEEILKYIAPFLYLNKSDVPIETPNENEPPKKLIKPKKIIKPVQKAIEYKK